MIVVFGSLNIDMVFSVPILPTAGETVLCPFYELFPGGKGANQAVAAARAGGNVKMFGKIGDDDFGHRLFNSMEKEGVDPQGLQRTDLATGCAMICVDPKGENIITVASGANATLKESDVPENLLTDQTTLVLQMEVPPEENWRLIRRAKEKGARIILNLAPAGSIPEDIMHILDVLVLNEVETTLLARILGIDGSYPRAIARRLTELYNLTVVVTMGPEGAYASSLEGNCNVKALKINAVDTTGAGDAFVGYLAVALDQGLSLDQALHKASVASGIACTRKGAQTSLPTPKEIEVAMRDIPAPRLVA